MNVSNVGAFYSGVAGVQKAFSQLDASASNIANQSLSSKTSNNTVQPSVEDSLVQLQVAELQGKASAKVIDRENQMIGSLIDIQV